MRKLVTLDIQFDVEIPVYADNDEEATMLAEEMSLNEILEWVGCASFSSNVVLVRDDA